MAGQRDEVPVEIGARDVDEDGTSALVVETPHERLGEPLRTPMIPLGIGAVPRVDLEDLRESHPLGIGDSVVVPRMCELVDERTTPVQLGSERPSPVVDLSPDGRWLATVEADGTWLRDLEPESLVEAACIVAGRKLTQQEWERYLPSNEPYRPTCAEWPDPTAD